MRDICGKTRKERNVLTPCVLKRASFRGYNIPSSSVSPPVRGGSSSGDPETNLANLRRRSIKAAPGDTRNTLKDSIDSEQYIRCITTHQIK